MEVRTFVTVSAADLRLALSLARPKKDAFDHAQST